MTTDESILEEMLERSTNPSKDFVDSMAVQMFCMVVNSNGGLLVTKAHEMILKKIRSTNTTESNRAIGILEECMSKGGEEFQKKTAKFTFLNLLIALVLDRHDAPPVPLETKKRIMECLMLWTAEHPDKAKIQEAYDNCKKQIDFDHGPTSVVANSSAPSLSNSNREQRSSILGKDDDLVAKLLKQGGVENYKKANLVIQHRFNQEARRTEFICHLKTELKKIESTMELLEEMLNSYSTDTPGTESQEIMQELYKSCLGQNVQMSRWPDFLGDSEPEFLDDVLITKDLLFGILQRYKELFDNDVATTSVTEMPIKPNALETKMVNIIPTTTTTNADLLSQLLGDVQLSSASASKPITNEQQLPKNTTNTTLDELTEIFGSVETKTEQTNYPTDLLGNLDLLEPISVFETETAKEDMEANNREEAIKPQGFKELREIDKLSEEIFKQSLQTEQRQATFKKEPEKMTLNDMAKDKIHSSLKSSKSNGQNIKLTLESKLELEDNIKVEPTTDEINGLTLTASPDSEMFELSQSAGFECDKVDENIKVENVQCVASKPLTEITISLDELTPLTEGQRMLLDDEDIEVSLNFTADRPSDHVSVIVMTVTNKSKLPVKDFQFEASAKKPSKVRLLPPTDTIIAGKKPFRPAESINQVILLMNPTQKAVNITCIVGYKLGDDPDPIKESIIAENIPYV